MKKGIVFLITVCLFFICYVISAYAGAYKSPCLGTKGTTLGAFIGKADDWSAIYYNPAGLAQLKGSGAAMETHYLYLTQKDGNSFKNFDAVNNLQGEIFLRMYPTFSPFGNEPTQFNNTKVIYSGMSPSSGMGGYCELKNGFVLGIGSYTPMGIATKWEDTIFDTANGATIDAEYFAGVKTTVYNISLAKTVNQYLSIGLGIDYVDDSTSGEASKIYNAPPPLAALNYNFDSASSSSGDGWEGILGVMLKPNDKLSIGGVYRSGAKIKLEGNARARHTLIADEQTDFTAKHALPASYGLGIAYKPKEKLTLTADWERTDWRQEGKRVDVVKSGILITNYDLDYDWKICNTINTGVEYEINSNLCLTGGLRWEQTPLSDDTVSMSNVIDMDKYSWGLGVVRKWQKLELNAGYATFIPAEKEINDVTYKITGHTFMLGGKYKF